MALLRFFSMLVVSSMICVVCSFPSRIVHAAGNICLVQPNDLPYVNAWESFSYPLDIFTSKPNSAGDSIHGGAGGINLLNPNGEGGWKTPWILEATSYRAELSNTSIDTGRIVHQDASYVPGSFSLMIRTPAINGPKRFFTEVSSGELWISFVFMDTGPIVDHDSGMFVLNASGKKLFLIGKPRHAKVLGIGNLSNGAADRLTAVSYSQPHHLMTRIVLNEGTGITDAIYLWIDPDEEDRLDSFDAGGDNLADISSIGGIMLSRRKDSGNGFFDDICVTTTSSLPPAGTIRIDLGFDPSSPLRNNSNWIWHDVISIDSFTDCLDGNGYGHNKDQNQFMVVRGYIYYDDRGVSRVARGIPIDRLSGLDGFVIAPFNDSWLDTDCLSGWKNALRFHPENGTRSGMTLNVPPGHYGQCRILLSGDGYGSLDTRFEYEDGTIQAVSFRSPDWMDDLIDDGHGGVITSDIVQLMNGMNRLGDDSFFEGSTPIRGEHPELDDASFFVETAVLDRTRKLSGIKIGPSSGSVVNVYDLLLDMETNSTSLGDWMMF